MAAFEKGDIDTYIVAFADNAVFTPSVQAFRVEGKAAIKGYFSALFETDPDPPRCHSAGLHAGLCERHYCGNERVLHPHVDR